MHVKLSIDGEEVTVLPGSTIIQAAEKLTKFIPHFCYHPGLTVVGQCRMCFVEIEGAPKLATACSTPVAEGMKILTESPKVKAGQNSTLEFTLLNHPLDCPICDRGGECKLQDFTYEYGPPRSRMIDDKELKDKHRPVSEEILLDQERCILCTRCVRFSSEIDGRAELVVNGRASHDVIDVFEGRPITSPFSGNVVDLCPVGALTAKDYRFHARPWELKRHDAICTGCANGCNVEIDTKHRHPGIVRPDKKAPRAQIMRLMPRENLDVNQYWMCDKGRWGYHFHNDDSKRLEVPMAKRLKDSKAQALSLREIQKIIDERTKGFNGDWEFWIDDNLPHEGIAWAKEIRKSWMDRGRKVESLNPNAFGVDFLKSWANRMGGPWTAGKPDWSSIKKIVSPYESYRDLESIVPILSVKLGQRIRKGTLQWEKRALGADAMNDDLASTAFLYPTPQNPDELIKLSKISPTAKVLLLFTHSNARGLVNEGIAPLELLENEFAKASPKGPVFFFAQRTQNPVSLAFKNYLSKAPFVIVADSFESDYSAGADVILPLTPLYESSATLTSVENFQQISNGIKVDSPNTPSLHRGGPIVSPSLRLL